MSDVKFVTFTSSFLSCFTYWLITSIGMPVNGNVTSSIQPKEYLSGISSFSKLYCEVA